MEADGAGEFRRDGDRFVANGLRNGPGGVFGQLTVGSLANAENILAKSNDLEEHFAVANFDAVGKFGDGRRAPRRMRDFRGADRTER